VEGTHESTLDVELLQQQLLELEKLRELDMSRSCPSLQTYAEDHSKHALSLCDTEDGLRSPIDLLRAYSSDKCKTLVVSFSGVSPGMGGISRYEFVGACERAGAMHVLFLRGLAHV
jgi:hypothetical protein